jgi:lysophosphatidylcholine acyltransferase/lyso-PAF acetyltransferase
MLLLGAFLSGAPVQPVCFKYRLNYETIGWTANGPSALMLLWLTMCQLNNIFEIHFLPVYFPNEEEKNNPELYAENVRKQMASYLNLPLSDYSFEDHRLMDRAQKYNLPFGCGRIKVLDLKKKLG